jgi:hypothetical protein
LSLLENKATLISYNLIMSSNINFVKKLAHLFSLAVRYWFIFRWCLVVWSPIGTTSVRRSYCGFLLNLPKKVGSDRR